MKPKYKKILTTTLTVFMFLIPMLLFGQEDENYNKLLQFLKGDGALEEWFMNAFVNLDTQIYDRANQVRLVGQAIGGIGALIYLSYLGFQMQEGARPWEVTPMLRPVIIGMILINWVSFTQLISYPLQQLATPSIAIFQDIEEEVNEVRILRYKKQNQLLDAIITKKAEDEAKEEVAENLKDKILSTAGDLVDDFTSLEELWQPIKEFNLRFEFTFQRYLAEFIEAISLTILRVCTYLIFFIQKVWGYVLITLGPIAVGMSLIPGWENAFNNWVSKFININLYTFIAYTIINIGQQLIVTGYEMEIDRYNKMIDDAGTVIDMDMLLTYVGNFGMMHTVLFPCVAFLISGIGVLMTPSIADSIVTAGGAGIMSKARAGSGTVARTGGAVRSAGKVVATKGAAIGSVAAKSMGKSAVSNQAFGKK